MFKLKAMKYSGLMGLTLTGSHLFSHGFISAENYVKDTAQQQIEAAVSIVATEFGYEPVTLTRSQSRDDLIQKWSLYHGVNPSLTRAVISVESANGKNQISHAGAFGLMQIMPDTAKRMCGIDNPYELFNESVNIECGTKILSHHINERGSVIKALVEYNGGAKCLASRKCTESENYWPTVLSALAKDVNV